MEQTALRPKPMPGQDSGSGRRLGIGIRRRLGGAARTPGAGGGGPGAGRRPHAARRRGRRLRTLFFGVLCSAVLVLSGVGLGTVSATVIGMSKLAEMQEAAGAPGGGPGAPGGPPAPGPSKPGVPAKPPEKDPGSGPGEESGNESGKESGKGQEPGPAVARTAIGVEAVDAPGGPGALLVGVHSPGPGHTAGLVRGDVLLAFGETRIGSARGLVAAVAAADPGRRVTLTVRHERGDRQSLSVTPGFVT
ncbi:PDZ domain-containing protein [Streptomyces sp. NPDC021622]|uniref:PDZ domain-containing protein n=1 Tax=Streptomyces sp. NPDC021622 TaxID=3155013 RepID=UPI0033C265EA